MKKVISLGVLAFVISFFVTTTYVSAQTASPSPTATQTPSAPSTGFGG